MISLGLLLTLGAVGGMVKGIANSIASDQEYNDKITELGQKKTDLETARSNATDMYNLNVANARGKAQDTIDSLTSTIGDVATSRDLSLRQGAGSLVQQQAILREQTAELQVSASDAQGSAIQANAVSGFRNTGSATNARVKSDILYSRAIAKSEAQRKLSLDQGYISAFNGYTNANMQISGYQRQIQYTRNELERTLGSYELNYRQTLDDIDVQKKRVQDDLDYANGFGRFLHNTSMFLDMASSTISGGTRAYSLFGGQDS